MNTDPIPALQIAGERVATRSSFEVVNPATGSAFARAPECSREHGQ